ncbi:condensation domain-containing protein [Streptomyces sp. NBC_00868]|uniref:condensation domain-containing protein n=1 Tax=unclassified Streptomyces TaxID=2593676 RepID=UPI00324E9E54|nr:condensation domain-containing protein [Streptomyces sp. NBC_00868]
MTAELPLSLAQTGVWLAQQLNPDERSFNIAEYCDIEGPVDPVLFEAALREVVAATPALRARFGIGAEGLCQYIDDTVDVTLHCFDLVDEPDPRAAAERWMADNLAEEYDLATGPLFTWALFAIGPERTLWYRAAHHVAVDGFAFALIASHVADVYTALATGAPRSPRPPGTLEQAIAADTAYQAGEEFAQDRRFWLDRMAGWGEVVALTDWHPTRTQASHRESGHLAPADLDALRSAARDLDVTWPEVVMAAVAVWLHRATGVRDLVVGLPVTARTEPLLRRVPAMLTNVVPLRFELSPELDFASVAAQASDRLREAMAHQRYPQERLVRELPALPSGRRQFGPDINIMSFNYGLGYGGHPATVHNLRPGPVDDLTVNVYDRMDGHGLDIVLDGNAELYASTEIAAHVADLVSLLSSVAGLLEADSITS